MEKDENFLNKNQRQEIIKLKDEKNSILEKETEKDLLIKCEKVFDKL